MHPPDSGVLAQAVVLTAPDFKSGVYYRSYHGVGGAWPLHHRRGHRLLCDDQDILDVSHDGQQLQIKGEQPLCPQAGMPQVRRKSVKKKGQESQKNFLV